MHNDIKVAQQVSSRSFFQSRAVRSPSLVKSQMGVFMFELSLALLIAAVAGAATIRTQLNVNRMQVADIQADVLNMYRNGLQTYADENYLALQSGASVTKNAVTLVTGAGVGQTRQPTVANLLAMGYLPLGFANGVLLADGAQFQNVIQLEPAGCVTVACNVRGYAYIDQPIVVRGSGGETDGRIIGQMLARIGGNAGTSVEGSANTITGVGGGWTWPNPVALQPAGVVAARFGFDASALGQFVRINDTRDPTFQGNLSAVGNLSIGGTAALAGATTVGGPLTVNNNTTLNGGASLLNGGGTTCINLDRNGVVTISCTGTLNARTGVFTDGLGNTSTVTPTGITATGRVNAARGLATSSGTVFDQADPNAISVSAGQQFFRGNSGALLLMSLDGGDVVAGRNLAGQRLALQNSAVPGAACANTSGAVTGVATEYASTVAGGLAVCSGGVWVSLNNRAAANSVCPVEGSIATDTTTGGGLICKRGFYLPADSAISNFVMGTPFQVTVNAAGDSSTPIVKSTVITCAPSGAGTGAPLVYILPQNETSINSAFSRTVDDSNPGSNLGTWTFRMKDGLGGGLTSVTAIALPYCFY